MTNQFRTGASMLLLPGTYYLQLGTRIDAGQNAAPIRVTLLGTSDDEPLGPAPVTPGATPVFACTDTPDTFCYPPDTQSQDPWLLQPETSIDLPMPGQLPIETPTDSWFINTNFARFNSALPLDANNDGVVTALDALLIINKLNGSLAGEGEGVSSLADNLAPMADTRSTDLSVKP